LGDVEVTPGIAVTVKITVPVLSILEHLPSAVMQKSPRPQRSADIDDAI
jgi:hypothetical protein